MKKIILAVFLLMSIVFDSSSYALERSDFEIVGKTVIRTLENGSKVTVYYGNYKPTNIVIYNGEVITAFEGAGIYRSPNGYNLGGGGSTYTVYTGSQNVVAMVIYKDSVITAFSGKGIYRSYDGKNLGGNSGSTVRIYNGNQLVRRMEIVDHGNVVRTTFEQGGVYESPSGTHLGGGGGNPPTRKVN